MTRSLSALLCAGSVLALAPPALGAQGYRVRVDTRFQSVAFRGVERDSILAAAAVEGPTGGLVSPEGFAVRCQPGSAYCTFFRPGPERRAGPLVSTVDVTLWGLGVPGLRFRAKGRVAAELADADVWPGTDPAVQLLDGYLEYARGRLDVELGRTHAVGRLGFVGLDGLRVRLHALDRRLRVAGYGGWGLARGAVLPVTSPALDPLDDFRPQARTLVAGGQLGWTDRYVEARVLYQREVDTGFEYLVSERAAFDAAVRPARALVVSGGADYDLATGLWGTADARLAVTAPDGRLHASVGLRHYRPVFDLWTIWGAFSPVPYEAEFAALAVVPLPGIELRGDAEAYRFAPAETATPLAQVERDGWRWGVAAIVTRFPGWTVTGGYHVDHGPGAASLGFEAGVTYRPTTALTMAADAQWGKRPLEYRFDEARVWSAGLRMDYRASSLVGLSAEVRRYDEERRRPDAARLDWDQVRVNLGVTLAFGSGADLRGLHPAILRIPERREDR